MEMTCLVFKISISINNKIRIMHMYNFLIIHLIQQSEIATSKCKFVYLHYRTITNNFDRL